VRGGKRAGAGRKPSLKTQVKRFEQEHPEAYDKLMEALYLRGLGTLERECPHCRKKFIDPYVGESEDAKYVIDRIKGKPKVTLGMDEEDREALNAHTVMQIFKLVSERQKLTGIKVLEEGRDGSNKGSQEAISAGVYEEAQV